MAESYLPAAFSASNEFIQGEQNNIQSIQRSQLNQLALERGQMQNQQMQKDSPLQDLTREVSMGEQAGALRRQADELQAKEDEAKFRNSATFKDSVKRIALAQNEEKERALSLKKQADNMDIFAQSFGPVLERLKEGDLIGARDAWDSVKETLEMEGVKGTTLDNAPLGLLQAKYEQALKTGPMIRKQYEATQASIRAREAAAQQHKYKLEEIEATEKARVAALKSGQPNTPNAVLARLWGQYEKDPSSLSETQKGMLRGNLISSFERYNEDEAQNESDRADAKVRQDEIKNNKGNHYSDRGARSRKLYEKAIGDKFRPQYPALFTGVTASPSSKDDLFKRFNLAPPKN